MPRVSAYTRDMGESDPTNPQAATEGFAEAEIVLTGRLGARACASLAQAAGRFQSAIVVMHGTRKATTTKIMDLMMLGLPTNLTDEALAEDPKDPYKFHLKAGAEVRVQATGLDAAQAVKALVSVLKYDLQP